MSKKTNTYASPEIQNEILKLFSYEVLCQASFNIKSSPFLTVMVDKAMDISNREQVVVCMRWVSANFEVQEDFIELSQVDRVLVAVIRISF